MKNSFILGCIAIILLSFFACKKKENAVVPVVKSPVTNPTIIDTTKQLLPYITYPHTDTFVGRLSVSFWWYQYTDSLYQFWVTYLSADSVVIRSSKGIPNCYNSIMNINDTALFNQVSGYYCNFYFVVHDDNRTYTTCTPNGIYLGFSGDWFSLNWDVLSVPFPGTCEFEENKGQFSGERRH